MKNTSITSRYTVFGIAFGLCFPLGGWSFECILNDFPFTLEGIKQIHLTTPVHYIIDSAPFVLGCTACLIGRIQKASVDREIKIQKELNKVQELATKDQFNTKRITEFSIFVSTGNLDFDVDIIDESDKLGNSLQEIQKSLFDASEKDKVEKWRAEGMTHFLQILRDQQNDIDALSKILISTLSKFFKSYYGAIYLATKDENDKTVLELSSSYAGKGLKTTGIKIEVGEGLIGQTFKSKKTTALDDIPESFTKINSGLGEMKPKHLFLVPLVHNNVATGVIELASFKALSKDEKGLLEKLCENIASTVLSAQVNTRNNLLLERSEKLGNELRNSEESMRQQIEEMRATQEELDRQNKSTNTKITAIEAIVGEIEWTESNEIKNPAVFEKTKES